MVPSICNLPEPVNPERRWPLNNPCGCGRTDGLGLNSYHWFTALFFLTMPEQRSRPERGRGRSQCSFEPTRAPCFQIVQPSPNLQGRATQGYTAPLLNSMRRTKQPRLCCKPLSRQAQSCTCLLFPAALAQRVSMRDLSPARGRLPSAGRQGQAGAAKGRARAPPAPRTPHRCWSR